MIEVVGVNRDEVIRKFRCSRRLATRVVALGQKKIALSATLLEEAVGDITVEKLLLERTLLDTDDLQATLLLLLEDSKYSEVADDMPLIVVTQDAWQVIALEEEAVLNSTPQEKPSTDLSVFQNKPNIVSNATESVAFNEQEVSKLRVEIFASKLSADKVAALRQFTFTNIPAEEKCAVFLQALADSDAELRVAAASGIRNFGVSAVVAENIQMLLEENRIELAFERIVDYLPTMSELEKNSLLMLLAGIMRDSEVSGELLRVSLQLLSKAAAFLAPYALSDNDFLVIMRERLINAPAAMIPYFRGAFCAIENVVPLSVSNALISEIEVTSSDTYRALLLDIVAGLPLASEIQQSLLPFVIATLKALPLDNPSIPMLRKFILDSGEDALVKLAKVVGSCTVSQQRSLIRFFDNALHSLEVSGDALCNIAESFLPLLKSAPLQLRTDLLDTQVCIRSDISVEIRQKVADILVADMNDYAHWPVEGDFENALARLGRPAVKPLLKVMSERKHTAEAQVVAKTLGRIGASLDTSGAIDIELAESILRELSTLSFDDSKTRDSMHLAMGLISSRVGISTEVNTIIMRSLLSRLRGDVSDAATIEALGYCCAGNVGMISDIQTIISLCMQHLEHEQADPKLSTEMLDGEEVLSLGKEAGIYSEMIPACLNALEAIITGEKITPSMRDELLDKMLSIWNNAKELNVIWGLVNVARLTEIFGRVGSHPNISDRDKLKIAATLKKRAGGIPVLTSLAEIVSTPNRLPQFDKMAASLAIYLMDIIAQSADMNIEDHERYIRILAQVISRGRFELRSGGDLERFYERVADTLIYALKQAVPGAQKVLKQTIENNYLSEAATARLEEEYSKLTSLVAL